MPPWLAAFEARTNLISGTVTSISGRVDVVESHATVLETSIQEMQASIEQMRQRFSVPEGNAATAGTRSKASTIADSDDAHAVQGPRASPYAARGGRTSQGQWQG